MSPLFDDEFRTVFIDQLRQFREQRFLCDVRLVASEMEYHAHKLVLAACSSYFKELFQMKRNGEVPEVTSVYLKNCQPHCVSIVLDYVYGNGLNLGHCNAADVLNVARACKISSLQSLLENFLDAEGRSATATGNDSSKKRKRQSPTPIAGKSQASPSINKAVQPDRNLLSPNGNQPLAPTAGKRPPGFDAANNADETWCSTHGCWKAACHCRQSPLAGATATTPPTPTPNDFVHFLFANAALFNPAVASNFYNSLAAAAALATGQAPAAAAAAAMASLPTQAAFASICQSATLDRSNTANANALGKDTNAGDSISRTTPAPQSDGKWRRNADDQRRTNRTIAEIEGACDGGAEPTLAVTPDFPALVIDFDANGDGAAGCDDNGGDDLGSPKSHKKCDDPTSNFNQILTDDRDGWCRNKKFIRKTPNGGYQCTLCKKTYGRYNSVSYHVTIYHRNPPIICDHAGCSFKTREARYIHFHKFYRHDTPLPSNIDLDARRCLHCKHVAKSPAMLDKHMKRHDVSGAGADPALRAVRAKPLYAKNVSLEAGARIADAVDIVGSFAGSGAEPTKRSPAPLPFEPNKEAAGFDAQSCDQCPYRTSSANTLTQHKLFKHSADLWLNKYHCDQCSYTSPSQAKIVAHKIQKHGGGAGGVVVAPTPSPPLDGRRFNDINNDASPSSSASASFDTSDDVVKCVSESAAVVDALTNRVDAVLDGDATANAAANAAPRDDGQVDLNKFVNFLVTSADSLTSFV